MSYENNTCPCGGRKERETMLCPDCITHIQALPELTTAYSRFTDTTETTEHRRSCAIRLLSAAHRRKSRQSLPLSYQFT
jgi:hypothetical protein